ncbi:tyrosine-type recombinase/integrase [Paraburkholderia caballeronis]|uniref:Site-specific recombinase XerD n=1 Tax=Paraburkholderia caballeronis TaxID=416943 RepID=A0A1H7N2G3_9BURK|nr:tyrosine-type recombinase/integrase [Paraburkholderia caballeronis]PXW26318.1 site-specific recombinase XerD [Paraburkholderia caballeronis]PXX01865.1 site-specific recombinase XerD [Paraburkholderia caballeronis]RAK01022.1 site-specific recombinase XerD [Paraburkholderia caballeronis]SEC02360.1 Site-specific recombinase XerD [Paraburkholderia caballeronis]SEL17145.1 Site-specific recombinase XerD [Paraburkholderia caballeronis]
MARQHLQPNPQSCGASYTRTGFPRLYVSRHGVYYWRERNRWRSLHTKDPRAAHLFAMERNLYLARQRQNRDRMSIVDPNYPKFPRPNPDDHQRFEIDLRRGIYKTNGTPEDAQALRETLEIIQQMPPPAPEPAAPLPPGIAADEEAILRAAIDEAMNESQRSEEVAQGGPMLSDVVDMWLTERALKNKPRTVNAKRLHLEDFRRRIGAAEPNDVGINTLRKSVLVSYKAALLAEGQTGKTADNKLLTLHDFFKYAINNGHYTASDVNPVAGLFVLTKRERLAKAESYEPFTPDDLRAVFEPAGFKTWASAPDLWFPPLVALFSGMRISEATAIATADVKLAENGVHYISIPDSKTAAGIRNVPVCDALISLGFLRYVEEVRSAGHDRLYPHRPFVNGTYSKRLSEKFRERLDALTITDPRKSFHSFRVNVITALANLGANTAQTFKITGHKDRDDAGTHLGYVRDLPDLKAVVDGLAWPINLDALAYDGRFAGFLTARRWERERRGGSRTPKAGAGRKTAGKAQ